MKSKADDIRDKRIQTMTLFMVTTKKGYDSMSFEYPLHLKSLDHTVMSVIHHLLVFIILLMLVAFTFDNGHPSSPSTDEVLIVEAVRKVLEGDDLSFTTLYE